jgi:hypothetical protein
MQAHKKIIIVALVILSLPEICGLAGLSIGWAMGTWNPGYYRSFFLRSPNLAQFDAVAFGMGQGLTQGIFIGVLLSAFVFLVSAWYAKRSRLESRFKILSSEVHDLQLAVERLLHKEVPIIALGETSYMKKVE